MDLEIQENIEKLAQAYGLVEEVMTWAAKIKILEDDYSVNIWLQNVIDDLEAAKSELSVFLKSQQETT